MTHLPEPPVLADLESALEQSDPSPRDQGTLEMIVRRPDFSKREVLTEALLDETGGLFGDNWYTRGSRHTEDGKAHPDMQITLMNSRILGIIAPDRAHWQLAGDQLIVDLDLSEENLPPGTRLQIGSALLEVSKIPHTGCKKFTERYGSDATRFVNSKVGRRDRRRGINARIIQSGTVRQGDTIKRLPPAESDASSTEDDSA